MNPITPPASFWRHSVTIKRATWSADASRGMTQTDADAGQTVVATVQDLSQSTRPSQSDAGDAITARRMFDVLIPRTNPATGTDQFPAATYPNGPVIRLDDTIQWNGRTLNVSIDVDPAGRGGFGLVYTAYCVEIV